MNQVEAKAGIIEAWSKRPAYERLEVHIPIFSSQLVTAGSPFLAFQATDADDKYQRIKTWLLPHVTQE